MLDLGKGATCEDSTPLALIEDESRFGALELYGLVDGVESVLQLDAGDGHS